MLVTEFTTEVVAASERFALWEAIAERSHLRNVLRSEEEGDFRARMRLLSLGEAQLSALALPHLDVLRTPRLIRQSDPEVYLVQCVFSGSGRLTQTAGTHEYGPGHLVMVDSSAPMDVTIRAMPGQWSSVVATVPRAWVPLPERVVRPLMGVPIPSCSGMAAVFGRWVTDLHHRAHEFTPGDAPTLATVTADLLTSLVGRCMDAEHVVPPEARRSTLRVETRKFVERNLGDLRLSPQTVADAHHISLRLLQQLFAEDGTSPAAWIRHRRLERCRADLADPHLAGYSVRAVAARWGLTDPAHFSRLFRAAYGLPPRDYRHRQQRRRRRT
ncbi:helix-turn-helix domain-containing protein [Streptomyces kebangsaanensis]|uniref:helix-turn-helix domain-containing protein n=1 Tax=Streptomyces kebangsaanensis TaxID=864058 RepID=UPI00093BC0B1|nr:helix-turn-helix domain-containing protein [Streptomyces kebangsaanensis]